MVKVCNMQIILLFLIKTTDETDKLEQMQNLSIAYKVRHSSAVHSLIGLSAQRVAALHTGLTMEPPLRGAEKKTGKARLRERGECANFCK